LIPQTSQLTDESKTRFDHTSLNSLRNHSSNGKEKPCFGLFQIFLGNFLIDIIRAALLCALSPLRLLASLQDRTGSLHFSFLKMVKQF
jgi:hypothetical protein